MTPRRLQLGLVAYAGLSGLVLANLFVLQGATVTRGGRAEAGVPSDTAARPLIRAMALQPVARAPVSELALVETARAVERELSARGYVTGGSDAPVGLATRAAIMAYEADHGLGLTGEPSDALLQRIILGQATAEAAMPVSARIGPQAEQVVRQTQQALAALKFGPLDVDGVPSDSTVQAIRKFERAQGMAETGRISGALIIALAKLAAFGHVPPKR